MKFIKHTTAAAIISLAVSGAAMQSVQAAPLAGKAFKNAYAEVVKVARAVATEAAKAKQKGPAVSNRVASAAHTKALEMGFDPKSNQIAAVVAKATCIGVREQKIPEIQTNDIQVSSANSSLAPVALPSAKCGTPVAVIAGAAMVGVVGIASLIDSDSTSSRAPSP